MGSLRRSRVSGGFSGGRAQFNISPFGTVGAFEFLNLMKTSQNWTYVTGSDSVDPADCNFDTNEYPRAIPVGTNGLYRKVYITTQTQRSGNWVIRWDGGGTIYSPSGTLVSGSKSSSAGTTGNRYEFSMSGSPSTDFIVVGVASVLGSSAGSYITNLELYHLDDEIDRNNGGTFGAKFLAKLRESGVASLRFLGAIGSGANGMNDTNITSWGARRPVGSVSYQGDEIRLSLYAGSTTNSGDDYTISAVLGTYAAGDGAPVNGETMIVKWSASATGNTITLTKGGVTYPVLRNDSTAHSNGSNNGRPASGQHHTLVFSSALSAWLNFGSGGVAPGRTYLTNGAAPEICLRLCSELGCHAYFVAPYLDTNNSFMTGLATYCAANAPSWMRVFYEGPNETWHSTNTTVFASSQYSKSVQLLVNGGSLSSNPTYNTTGTPTVVGSGSTGTTTCTIGAHTLQVGSNVTCAAANGYFGMNGGAFVTAITGTTITINKAPTGGTWSPGTSTLTFTPNSGDYHSWYGEFASRMGEAIASAYGVSVSNIKDQDRFNILCAVQTFSTIASSNERLEATSYVLRGGRAAKEVSTHVAVATYYHPSIYADGNIETTLATAYAGGDLTAPATYLGYLGGAAGGTNIADCLAAYGNWKAWAVGKSVVKICAYEGCYSPDYTGNATLDNLRRASKYVAALQTYDQQNNSNFLSLGDSTCVFELPSYLAPFGRLINGVDTNAWVLLSDIYADDVPQWLSLKQLNAGL